jgi:hypothetical protein
MDVEIVREGADWIHVAYEGDEWQVVVNTVLNVWVP